MVTDPKIFLKAPVAPMIYTNFEGGARAKKTRFFGQNFPKSAFRPYDPPPTKKIRDGGLCKVVYVLREKGVAKNYTVFRLRA